MTLTIQAGPSVYSWKSAYALEDGNYQLTIAATQVTYQGLQLDGDRNGTAGDNYVFGATAADNFYRLYGDMAGQNRLVNLVDYAVFRSAYGAKTGDAAFRWELDFDGNGVMNLSDYAAFRARYGKCLAF